MRLAKPSIGNEELHEIKLVLESGYCAQGLKVAEFERMVSEYLGVKYAFATSSCTTALHLVLYALGIGPGEEVLVPDFTFPATSNVVVQCGSTPVLVDIELETFTIDVEDLARKVSPRSRVVIPVHLFGLSANMGPILDIAKRHDLFVVEDAACALGAVCLDRYCGTMGIAGCFSFHPRKVITTGEGGMIVTNDDDLAEKITLLRGHGGKRENERCTFHVPGFNYRMSDIQGAMGVAQMRKLPSLISRRQQLAREFDRALFGIENVHLPKNPSWGNHTYQSYVVLVENRDAMIERLACHGIESTLGTYALHRQPMFGGGDFPNSNRAYAQSLALPFWPGLKPETLFAALGERNSYASSLCR